MNGSSPAEKVRAVYGVALVLFSVTVALWSPGSFVFVGGASAQAGNTGTDSVSLACVGTGGGDVYTAASGLTVYDNDTDATLDSVSTPDSQTVRLEYAGGAVNVSAAGNAEARVESATGPTRCLGDVDAPGANVSVAPDGADTVTLGGLFEGFSFRDANYTAADSGVDLAYDASDPATVTVGNTGYADGTEVRVIDASDGSQLSTATVDADGSVTLDGLSAGRFDLNLEADNPDYLNLALSEHNVTTNESFDVSATVINNDESNSQEYTAELQRNGTVVDSKSGTLAAAGNTQVTFTTSIADTGSYDITVDDIPAQTVEVSGPISYTEFTVSDTTVTPGESVDVSATVINNDDSNERQYTAALRRNGTVVDTKSGTLSAAANTQVTFTTSIDETGSYDISIDDTGPATVEVVDPISYTEFAVSDRTVASDESFDASTTVINNDESNSQEYTAELQRNGTVVDTKSGTLSAAANTQVTFTTSIGDTGSYAVSITDTGPTTVEVTEAVSYTDLSVSDTTVSRGESFDVSATVSNNDDSNEREYTAELRRNGTVVDTTSGTLTAAGNREVTFTSAISTGGHYSMTVANLPAVVVTVEGPPTAANDSYAVTANTTLSVDSPGVLANDSDPDGDSLTASVASGPTDGDLTLYPNGSFEYTPDAGFAGEDSFTYTAGDGDGGTDTATVTLTVRDPPDFETRIVSTDSPVTEGNPLQVTANVTNTGGRTATQTVTLTDTGFDDLTRDSTTVTLAGGESDGSVTLVWSTEVGDADAGAVTVASANDTVTGEVTVTSADTNDPPTATADSYETTAGSRLGVTESDGVLANDSDPDGDSLTATVESGPTDGSLTLYPNGSFEYAPDAGFTGEDSFTYTARDGNGGTDMGSVTITVTEPVTLPGDFRVAITAANGSAVAGDRLVVGYTVENRGIVADTQDIAVTVNDTVVSTRSISLDSGESLSASVPYATTAGDVPAVTVAIGSDNDTASRTVPVAAQATNGPPRAGNESYTVGTNGTLSVPEPGVLGGDTDPEGDSLTATVVDAPSHGTLRLARNGSFTYGADDGYAGQDTFTYRVSDDNGGTDRATVSITVADGPANFTVAINETNEPLTAGETLTVTADVTNVGERAGTQTLTLQTPDGSVVDSRSLTLDAGSGTAVTLAWPTSEADAGSVAITVAGANDTATRSVTVTDDGPTGGDGGGTTIGGGSGPSNGPPTATDDSYTVAANTTLSIPAEAGVLATDSDPDDDREALSVTPLRGPSHGRLALGGNGSFSYTPDPGFAGTDTFTYEVSDGDGGTDTATVSINVTQSAVQTTVLENATGVDRRVSTPVDGTPTAAEQATIRTTNSGTLAVSFTNRMPVASVRVGPGIEAGDSVTVAAFDGDGALADAVPGRPVVTLWSTVAPGDGNGAATVHARFSRAALDERNVTASDLQVATRADGRWQPVNATVENRSEEGVTVVFTGDDSSPFVVTAIGTPAASLSGTETSVAAGEELTLDASGSGTPYGDVTDYQWSVAGQTHSGETATVRIDDPGEYTLELRVTSDAGRTATATTTVVVGNGTTTPTTTGGNGPGLGVVTALLALLGLLLFGGRRVGR